jgi:DNA ligase (NAD+)
MEKVSMIKEQLIRANDLYRQGTPIMTDEEFDALEERLRVLNPDDEWFKKGVNDKTPKSREYKLPYPMMSLDKVKTIEALRKWASKFPNATFVITPKYDGLSVGISNELAWTRGDGEVGQICTEQTQFAGLSPVEIEDNEVIRGEIIITNKMWKTFRKHNPTAKSQRNSATGLINGDYDESRVKDYHTLSIMPYEIMGSKLSKRKQLNKYYNFNYSYIANVEYLTEDFLFSLFKQWRKKFPIDGLVIDVEEAKFRHGVEANGNPSYTIAYKHLSFSERKDGIIDRIERNINRNGIITPVVVLKEPVNISGADIQKISAINMRYVKDWGLYPDTTVTIVRSGEVIPKIVAVETVDIPFRENFTDNKTYEIHYKDATNKRICQMLKVIDSPETGITIMKNTINDFLFDCCPVCGGKLTQIMNDDGDWCDLRCDNVDCDGRMYGRISKFFEILGIKEFGRKTFDQLIDHGFIESSPFEVFDLTVGDLKELEGWGDVSAHKFVVELNRIRQETCFARFLHATGWFADLGEKTLQKIIDADGWDKDLEYLCSIEGVQETTAQKFINGFNIYIDYDVEVSDLFSFTYYKTPKTEGKLAGLVFCMTGFRDKEMSDKIIELGGVVSDGVTKETTCLIVKDMTSNSSKVQKARKNGIEIIDRETFLQTYL